MHKYRQGSRSAFPMKIINCYIVCYMRPVYILKTFATILQCIHNRAWYLIWYLCNKWKTIYNNNTDIYAGCQGTILMQGIRHSIIRHTISMMTFKTFKIVLQICLLQCIIYIIFWIITAIYFKNIQTYMLQALITCKIFYIKYICLHMGKMVCY